jgi:hypothetical protein
MSQAKIPAPTFRQKDERKKPRRFDEAEWVACMVVSLGSGTQVACQPWRPERLCASMVFRYVSRKNR